MEMAENKSNSISIGILLCRLYFSCLYNFSFYVNLSLSHTATRPWWDGYFNLLSCLNSELFVIIIILPWTISYSAMKSSRPNIYLWYCPRGTNVVGYDTNSGCRKRTAFNLVRKLWFFWSPWSGLPWVRN